jgi:hypothetical protein
MGGFGLCVGDCLVHQLAASGGTTADVPGTVRKIVVSGDPAGRAVALTGKDHR